MTGHEAAALLGVSRRTVYRWIDEGRLPYPLTRETFPTQPPAKRARGPQPNPRSKRYTVGRHTFRPRQEKASATNS